MAEGAGVGVARTGKGTGPSMNTALECLPCLLRQAGDALQRLAKDKDQESIWMRHIMSLLGTLDYRLSPPAVAQLIHRRLRQLSGSADPYRVEKEKHTRLALALYPRLEAEVAGAGDPLLAAVQVAIAGNIIDLGAKSQMEEADIRASLEQALREPLSGNFADFASAVSQAGSILYLADNAGEVVFDRLLLQRLPQGKVTVAVRGGPVINDAVWEDARMAGLTDLVPVIDNGSDAPGTLLSDCSETFQEIYQAAGVVIAKGQGNFESLSEENKNIYFLFKIKCPVVASLLDLPMGTKVLRRQHVKGPLSVSG